MLCNVHIFLKSNSCFVAKKVDILSCYPPSKMQILTYCYLGFSLSLNGLLVLALLDSILGRAGYPMAA